MSKYQLLRIEESDIEIIDGDRGVNYPPKSEFSKSGHCVFLNTGNVSKAGFDFDDVDFISEERDSLLRKGKAARGDIILTTRGTVGNVGFFGNTVPFDNVRINSGMVIIRTKAKEIDPYYFYFFLRSQLFKKQVVTNGSGSAQPQLPISALKNIAFPLPQHGVQQKIAAVLSAFDAKIEINNSINAELEAMARTLYDYWFVQFDFPDESGQPYKSSGGEMVYNDVLKQDLPVGWSDSNILAVANLLGGGTPTKKKSEYWGGQIPFFTPTDADGNVFKFSTEDLITDAGLKCSSTKLFDENTVLITARGSVGKLALAGVKMAMNQSCYALKAKPGISYAFLFFLTKELIHHLAVKSSGSVFDSIVSNDIEQTLLAIPAPDLVAKYAQVIEPAFAHIAKNTLQNQQLTQLRDWLLPMLMNGQVTVE